MAGARDEGVAGDLRARGDGDVGLAQVEVAAIGAGAGAVEVARGGVWVLLGREGLPRVAAEAVAVGGEPLGLRVGGVFEGGVGDVFVGVDRGRACAGGGRGRWGWGFGGGRFGGGGFGGGG